MFPSICHHCLDVTHNQVHFPPLIPYSNRWFPCLGWIWMRKCFLSTYDFIKTASNPKSLQNNPLKNSNICVHCCFFFSLSLLASPSLITQWLSEGAHNPRQHQPPNEDLYGRTNLCCRHKNANFLRTFKISTFLIVLFTVPLWIYLIYSRQLRPVLFNRMR